MVGVWNIGVVLHGDTIKRDLWPHNNRQKTFKLDPQAAENSPYPPKLYLAPKKFCQAGYQPNFDEELAAGKIPAKIRLNS